LHLHNAAAGGNPFAIFYSGSLAWGITFGALLATTMFLNVWLVIWPKQQIIIASNAAVMGGGQANPDVPKAARRAALASRTNTLFSVPMLAFMIVPRWFQRTALGDMSLMIWSAWAIVVIGVFEFSCLTGDKGPLTKPLDTVKSVLTAGTVLALASVILYAVLP
jgi:uncharacterized membrane protein